MPGLKLSFCTSRVFRLLISEAIIRNADIVSNISTVSILLILILKGFAFSKKKVKKYWCDFIVFPLCHDSVFL